MKALKDLKYKLMDELEEMSKKDISSGSLEIMHKLTDTIKNIDKICVLEKGGYSEEASYRRGYSRDGYSGDGYSSDSYGGRWEAGGEYGMDGSYRRRRDSMGRYTRGGDMKEHIEKMMRETNDPHEKEALRRLMSKMNED